MFSSSRAERYLRREVSSSRYVVCARRTEVSCNAQINSCHNQVNYTISKRDLCICLRADFVLLRMLTQVSGFEPNHDAHQQATLVVDDGFGHGPQAETLTCSVWADSAGYTSSCKK